MQNNLDNNFVLFCTSKKHRKDLPFIQEYLFETDRSHFCKNPKKLQEIVCSFGKSKLHQRSIERIYNLFRKPIDFFSKINVLKARDRAICKFQKYGAQYTPHLQEILFEYLRIA